MLKYVISIWVPTRGWRVVATIVGAGEYQDKDPIWLRKMVYDRAVQFEPLETKVDRFAEKSNSYSYFGGQVMGPVGERKNDPRRTLDVILTKKEDR